MKKIKDLVEIKSQVGIFDLIDNIIKESYNINDSEYVFICENATDSEIEILVDLLDNPEKSFSDIRIALNTRNKYLKRYENEK
jgi:hypothetical protein